jgi:hypothetical protein
VSERFDDDRVAAWRDWAKADAERRGLPELAPLIGGLSTTIARLRAGDWNADARRAAKAGDER